MVLGHVTSGRGPIPSEQKIVRLKHSPGSGVLSVAVVSDGPTRILKITDENKKVSIKTTLNFTTQRPLSSPRTGWILLLAYMYFSLASLWLRVCSRNVSKHVQVVQREFNS